MSETMIKQPLAAMLLAAVLAAPAAGRDDANWNNLRTLKSGQPIGIIQSDGKRTEGKFAGVSDSAISILTDQAVNLPKESVARVYRRPRLNRGLRTLIGAGIGVAVGAVLNGTIGQYLRNEAHGTSPAVWIGVSGGIGAGIGAASGGGQHTVYRRTGHP